MLLNPGRHSPFSQHLPTSAPHNNDCSVLKSANIFQIHHSRFTSPSDLSTDIITVHTNFQKEFFFYSLTQSLTSVPRPHPCHTHPPVVPPPPPPAHLPNPTSPTHCHRPRPPQQSAQHCVLLVVVYNSLSSQRTLTCHSRDSVPTFRFLSTTSCSPNNHYPAIPVTVSPHFGLCLQALALPTITNLSASGCCPTFSTLVCNPLSFCQSLASRHPRVIPTFPRFAYSLLQFQQTLTSFD